jgi:hypothetical protein
MEGIYTELNTRIRHRDPWQYYGPLPTNDLESLLAATRSAVQRLISISGKQLHIRRTASFPGLGICLARALMPRNDKVPAACQQSFIVTIKGSSRQSEYGSYKVINVIRFIAPQ